MKWYEEEGRDNDVVLSSKVHIVRNIKGFSFPSKMTLEEKENVLGRVVQATSDTDLKFARSSEITDEQKTELFKHRIIEISFVNDGKGKGILINNDEDLSVVVNECDHLKIQAICSGSNIPGVYKKAQDLSAKLENNMDIAFSERLGFLTARPREVGSGIRIACMVSIPGIEKSGTISQVIKRFSKIDWQLTPVMSDSFKKHGSLYMVGNLATLGITEEELITRGVQLINELVKLERICRNEIYRKNKLIIEDSYLRAFGTLKYAKKIDVAETLDMLSWMRLGQGHVDVSDGNINWMKINRMTERVSFELIKNQNSPLTKLKGINTEVKLSQERAVDIQNLLKGADNK